jgi:hypothetical protein
LAQFGGQRFYHSDIGKPKAIQLVRDVRHR